MEAEGAERKKKNATTVRHAPPDPTLPAPWKGLIDVASGNLYFWNPVTKVTQYERPRPEPEPAVSSAEIERETPIGNAADAGDLRTPTPAGNAGNAGNAVNADAGTNTPVGIPSSNPPTPKQQPVPTNPNPNPNPIPSDISPDAYRRQHEIAVLLHGTSSPPPPFTTFESTRFPPGLIRALYSAGFSRPSPIQAQSWPIALQGRDLIAVAKTGSGKTLGFLLPAFLLLKRLNHDRTRGPSVLVLSPTRELATQIQDQALKFGRPASIATTALYGGAPKGPQLQELQRGTDVVVATPGRLNDILEMGKLSLQQVAFLVLDEADRMLDMGFEPQIRKIATHLPPRRQTLMFTATWPREVRDIASHLLRNPVQVSIGNTDTLTANKAITQHVEVISSMEKRRRLEQILRSQDPNAKTIIFCSTKKMCDMLARNLQQNYGASAIHGDKSQSERDSVLADFRAGRSRVLVATDVASRGLDIKDIKVVVNYDFPSGVEDYVHRIGRTGRAGATGTAFTFFCDQDGKYASELVKVLEGAGQKVPPELKDMVGRGGYGGRPRRWESSNTGGGGGGGGYSNGSSTWGASASGGNSSGGASSGGAWGSSGGGGSNGSGSAWGSSGGGGSNGSGSAWGSSGGGGSNGSGSAWGSSGGGGSNCGGNGSGSTWGSSGGGGSNGWGSAT